MQFLPSVLTPNPSFTATDETVASEVLQRVSNGELLREILSVERFPSEAEWSQWLARDAILNSRFLEAVNSAHYKKTTRSKE